MTAERQETIIKKSATIYCWVSMTDGTEWYQLVIDGHIRKYMDFKSIMRVGKWLIKKGFSVDVRGCDLVSLLLS